MKKLFTLILFLALFASCEKRKDAPEPECVIWCDPYYDFQIESYGWLELIPTYPDSIGNPIIFEFYYGQHHLLDTIEYNNEERLFFKRLATDVYISHSLYYYRITPTNPNGDLNHLGFSIDAGDTTMLMLP